MNAERFSRLQAEGGWYRLGGGCRVALTGPDRVRYLNGQVSNDVRRLSPGGPAIAACVLSARGKLDAVVWIWAEPDRLVVEADAALAGVLAARLERYIVADDVTLEELPAATGVHAFGAAATGCAGRPIARLGRPGCDLDGEPVGRLEATAAEIERLRVAAGVPHWGAELDADTLPAEAGLDQTAVDFNKGCYLGQEIVSRVRSVGHVNRRLCGFLHVSGAIPAPGAEYFLEPGAERAAAVVTSVDFALSPAIGLCYMRRGTTEGAVLVTADGSSTIQLRQPERPHA